MTINERSKGVIGAMNASVGGFSMGTPPTPPQQQISIDIGTVNDKVAFNLTGTLTQLPALLTFDVAQAYQMMAAMKQAIDTVESNRKAGG